MPPKDLRTREMKEAMYQDQVDARDWANTWENLAAQRYAAAAKGESTPWLGVKQWLAEVPLDINIRGYDSQLTTIPEQREAAFQAEMQRLQKAYEANPKKPPTPKTPWSGVR